MQLMMWQRAVSPPPRLVIGDVLLEDAFQMREVGRVDVLAGTLASRLVALLELDTMNHDTLPSWVAGILPIVECAMYSTYESTEACL